MLAFAPRSSFRLLSGEDSLTEYLFNRHVIRHQFCRTGGIECFASGQMPDGTPMVAINVDCLDGVEPRPLPDVFRRPVRMAVLPLSARGQEVKPLIQRKNPIRVKENAENATLVNARAQLQRRP